MKFSCDLNDINYFFEVIKGHQLGEKFRFLLSTRQRKMLESGKMEYCTLIVCASKDDLELKFELQGIPLSTDQEERIEEIEDHLENNLVFSKIEEKIQHALSQNQKPIWAEK